MSKFLCRGREELTWPMEEIEADSFEDAERIYLGQIDDGEIVSDSIPGESIEVEVIKQLGGEEDAQS